MTNRAAVANLRNMAKTHRLDLSVVRVGTGKHITVGLYGAQADRVASFMCDRFGFVLTPMSGAGTRVDLITITQGEA
jgi:hypothetical protein